MILTGESFRPLGAPVPRGMNGTANKDVNLLQVS
jgi:hypothetical protein